MSRVYAGVLVRRFEMKAALTRRDILRCPFRDPFGDSTIMMLDCADFDIRRFMLPTVCSHSASALRLSASRCRIFDNTPC